MNRKITLFVILALVLVSGLTHNTYANEYVSEEKLFASDAIDQRAIDVATQLELYLEAHTDMTLQDLKNDVRFNELAIQQVGETGYTYLIVHETGILEFHPDPNIRGGSYNNFKERFPVIWNIIDETISSPECVDSSGFYDWEDINNVVREKYTYHHCLEYKTIEGYTFFIGASTYLDEYETNSIDTEDAKTSFDIFENNLLLYLIIAISSILLTLFVLHKYKITITNKLTKKIIIQFTVIAVIPIILLGSIMYVTQSNTSESINQLVSDHVEGDMHTTLSQSSQLLTNYIEEEMRDYHTFFEINSISNKYGLLLQEADNTGTIKDGHFYPSDTSGTWQEVQNNFRLLYHMQDDEMDLIRLFHKNGYVVNGVALGEEDIKDYKGDKSWFADVMNPSKTASNEIYISPISIARRTNSPAIRYVTPVEYNGERLGLFIINFKSQAITKEIQNYHLGESGYALLVDYAYENAEGDILDWPVILSRSTNGSIYMIDESESAQYSINKNKLTAQQSMLDQTIDELTYHIHYQKVNVEGKDWYVFIVAPMDEMHIVTTHISSEMDDINQQSNLIFLIATILTAVGAVVIGFIFSKSIAKPISQLSNMSRQIRDENYKARVEIKTGDELEELGSTLNATSEALGKLDVERKKIDHAKTEFMSITSHEMRSPMTPMRGQLQLLLAGTFGKLSKKQTDSLDIVLRNATRLDSIIQDFLEISRIEAARLKFDFKKGTNINEHINRLVTEMRNFMPEKNIKITTNLAKVPAFEVDPNRIMQILRNLTNNALKFTPKKGTIEITTEKQGKYILFKVKDSGIGISTENQLRIFEPFFQEEQTMYREHGGTGLGLAICRGIAEAQGGKIWLESIKGKGTTFFFTIPLKPVYEIAPIKLLFSKKEDVEEKLELIFTEMLGPIGKSEIVNIKVKGLVRANVNEYINEITKIGILTKETNSEFKRKVAKLFGAKSDSKTSLNALEKSGLIATSKKEKRTARAVGVSLSELQNSGQVEPKEESPKSDSKDLYAKEDNDLNKKGLIK
jgi:signal transduction histidine kinase